MIIEETFGKIIDGLKGIIGETERPSVISEMYAALSKKYRGLIRYANFKSDILQALRELGNCIIITQQLEETLRLKQTLAKGLVIPIIGETMNSTSFYAMGQVSRLT